MDMANQSQDLQLQAMLLNQLTQVKIMQSQQVHHALPRPLETARGVLHAGGPHKMGDVDKV